MIPARVALGNKPAEKVIKMHSAGMVFTGTSTGLIKAADAIRNEAKTLKINLMPHEGKLVGRVLAMGGNPDSMNSMLPYVLTLNRPSP